MTSKMRSLVRALLHRDRLERDMAAEMRFHMDAFEGDLIASGVDPSEARPRTLRQFGSLESAREECREARGLRWFDEIVRNVRYSARTLRQAPGFTATAVLTLALCLGANTALFSVVDAVMFRPLPYPQPDRLGQVVKHFQGVRGSSMQASQDGAMWEALQGARSFDIAALRSGSSGVNLATGEQSRYVRQHRVSAGYFRVLGVEPILGREFTEIEDRRGGPPVTLISHGIWQQVFGGNPAVLGQALLIGGEPHTVIGVLPSGLRTAARPDVWTPLRPSTSGEGVGTNYTFYVRLREGATWAEADAEARTLGAPALVKFRVPEGITIRTGAMPLQSATATPARSALYVLWGAAAVVLLIGCANIAALLLARSGTRTREIGTRLAIGGGSGAVIRQMLTESATIALLGGIAGLLVGYAAMRGLAAALAAYGVWQEPELDWRVMSLSLAVAAAASIVFGLAPALQAARLDIRECLAEGGSRAVAGSRSQWMSRSLITIEVALSVMLLVGAGLLIKTLLHLNNLNPGFESDGVLMASVSMQDARYREKQRILWLYDRTLERLRATQGIESAAVALHVPYQRWLNGRISVADGAEAGRQFTTARNYVTPGYFETLRIPLRSGRVIDERDAAKSAPVVVINEAFARQYLNDANPVGRHLRFAGEEAAVRIVGVVGNVQQAPSFGQDLGPLESQPSVFVPVAQFRGFEMVHSWFTPAWLVRGSSSSEMLAGALRGAIADVDPMLPVSEFQSFDDLQESALKQQRIRAWLLSALAGLALVLAAVGIYGLVSRTVSERRREIGIRLALGGSVMRVIAGTVRPGVMLACLGAVIGCVLAAAGTVVLRTALHGVQHTDAGTYAAVAALLVGVAVAASVAPAVRIAGLDPAGTLRQE